MCYLLSIPYAMRDEVIGEAGFSRPKAARAGARAVWEGCPGQSRISQDGAPRSGGEPQPQRCFHWQVMVFGVAGQGFRSKGNLNARSTQESRAPSDTRARAPAHPDRRSRLSHIRFRYRPVLASRVRGRWLSRSDPLNLMHCSPQRASTCTHCLGYGWDGERPHEDAFVRASP